MFKAKSVGNYVILHMNNREESVLQTTKATKSSLFLVKHVFFHLFYNFRDLCIYTAELYINTCI